MIIMSFNPAVMNILYGKNVKLFKNLLLQFTKFIGVACDIAESIFINSQLINISCELMETDLGLDINVV